MAEIISFPNDAAELQEREPTADDLFLLEEGLELLAAYRAIRDPAIRESLLRFVKSLSSKVA